MSTSIFGVLSDYQFLFHFSIKLLIANRIAPEGSMWPYSLPMSHKRMPGLYELKKKNKTYFENRRLGFYVLFKLDCIIRVSCTIAVDNCSLLATPQHHYNRVHYNRI